MTGEPTIAEWYILVTSVGLSPNKKYISPIPPVAHRVMSVIPASSFVSHQSWA
jgi:hypothetical protein